MREERFKEVVKEAEAKFAEIHEIEEINTDFDRPSMEERGTMMGMKDEIEK